MQGKLFVYRFRARLKAPAQQGGRRVWPCGGRAANPDLRLSCGLDPGDTTERSWASYCCGVVNSIIEMRTMIKSALLGMGVGAVVATAAAAQPHYPYYYPGYNYSYPEY